MTAGKIAAGTIVAADIAAGTITGAKIATGTITADQIAALTIGTDEIAANSITTDKIAANQITADLLASTLLLASLIQTAASGRRIELDVDGVRLYDTDESLLVRIPTDGNPVYVKGEVNADTLVSQTAATFRTAASIEGNATMTLQNGISAPKNVPTLTASVDYLTKAASTGSLAAAGGIAYDAGAGTFWIACDPTVSPYYVAQEFNATTGALVRSIAATGSTTTYTTTLGSTSEIKDTWYASSYAADSQIATPLTMPRDGTITKVAGYLAGYGGDVSEKMGLWSSSGVLRRLSAAFTAAEKSTSGGATLYNKSLSSGYAVTSGTTVWAGWCRTTTGQIHWWSIDSGSGKTTKHGSNYDDGDFTDIQTDSDAKPNVYITYTYDVDTRLETAPNVGIATDGTYIYVLDNTGVVWKYLRSDLSYVAKSSVQTAITGTKSKAGMFYDATAAELIITTTTGTGAGVYPKFVRVNPATLAVSTSVYSASAGSTFDGATDTFRGGARLNDPLNSNAATYWVATTNAVYAYTFSGTAATQTSNRNFGTAASSGDGLTHDGTVFRGWDIANPTKIWKFSAWDWTTASAVYWIGYSWYDSAGTTHETACGPRASITMRRRERLLVQNAAIPTGGADDPDKVRIYMLPGTSDWTAGTGWLQVTDALTARYLSSYTGSGTHDGTGTAFPAGTPAELKSSASGWSLKGDGSVAIAVTQPIGGKPPTVHTYLATDSPATWTKPAGLSHVIVEVIGGGGGGGGVAATGASQGAAGSGGGGGGYARALIAAASLGSTETVTIGSGGAGGAAGANNGSAGGDSYFRSGTPLARATGGAGGTGDSAGTRTQHGGGAGGVGDIGDVLAAGSYGGNSAVRSYDYIGGNYGGAAGAFSGSVRGGLGGAGIAGLAYGGGGSGAGITQSTAAAAGGAGAGGIVIVTEFYGA